MCTSLYHALAALSCHVAKTHQCTAVPNVNVFLHSTDPMHFVVQVENAIKSLEEQMNAVQVILPWLKILYTGALA